ncbi:translational GTPase TypA [Paraclostridium sordellii]|uniref:translational GTPase TypA n=1 Tax=Paraclostridium sordellii TaxID=1505 RepID=UPI00038586F4|nr:translational GTPase TypA [Paeniclostridium sordellii]EPZ59677.1 GTP-binding protein TypA/BipA [[Clostridium] sordellii VPI 9048] [Paeniclostridium sordellii VPI 9048]CEK38868.1 GTP-binding protein BipA [[Clostridium] sordellii] [Paeniclostridium sordellii]CEP81337.1 GTP-binding protein BipA [[Clostridium] sordellii] [Paeniclostridium sordellii]
MTTKNKIVNIAVIAHVDAGKSTLVDAFLSQSGVFRANEVVKDCVMDSNDLEKERGITIYSKNCAINYKDYKINIVDTPGHSDFSSEVERVIKTVDTVILLVDASEGPMPQTRFVLQKSLEAGLRPILFINKIDKQDQRAEEVVDEVFDLFVDLNATDEQCEFPIIYGIAKQGVAKLEMDDDSNDLSPLFETVVNHVDAYPDYASEPLQLQVSALAYDDYVGRLGIGRVYKGTVKNGSPVSVCKADGTVARGKISKLTVYEGLRQVEKDEAYAGDIVVVAGMPDISIGETICDVDNPLPMELIHIEEPTLSMNFLVNDSPFCGKSGKFVTTRHIKDRLDKELEVNVGLKVEPMDTTDGFKVSGRGELHLSILLENMRREGYEIGVSKPEVLFIKEDGKLMEPMERVIVNCPEVYSGTVINKLNLRKAMMEAMEIEGDYVKITFIAPTRGLLGYRSEFINDTRGEGTIVRSFERYEEHKGSIPGRTNGVLVAQGPGTTMAYALSALSERAQMFVDPGVEVYEGMIIGMNSRKDDMVVNPCKNKKLTNVRASGTDDAVKLQAARTFTLEEALEFIDDDELVEITPDSIRLRKRFLNENERLRYNKSRQASK